jgi:DNA-binding GntR family transcriptional regulator
MKDIREMFWVMGILEGKCARLCAKRTDEEGLQKLDDLYRKLEKQYQEKNHEGYMDVNHRYHSLVQDLAGNKILSEVIDNLRQKILLYRYRQIYQPDRLKASMQEHSELQKAFREKNPAAAERLMKEHLMRQCEALESVYTETLNSPRS